MKPAARRILYRIALPGIVLTFFACNEPRQKHPLGQWPVKPPKDVQYASYTGGPARAARLSVALNGEQWEAKLHYRGAELDSVEVTQGGTGALATVLRQAGADAFSLPAALDDSTDSADLTPQWVSRDFEEGGRLIAEDVTFDGHPDLLVFDPAKSGASNQFYDLWVYEPVKKDYFRWELPNRTGLGLWDIDRAKHTLTLGYRANEDEQVVEVYKVVKDTAVKLLRKLDTRKGSERF
ncbi:MAG: hypothetical protein EOO11_15335 [Chitinophagaceae bacterium]|nr:MAG: hypothetical protein EOO11_15335 [Chitinophagaceae bacterium]